jgi:hypothetical protein
VFSSGGFARERGREGGRDAPCNAPVCSSA